MAVTISKTDRQVIISLLENGSSNGRISLKFPGIRKTQINNIRDEINSATEQTKRKLKSDPLLNLYNSQSINLDDLYAAEYIRYAYTLINAGITIRVMSFEGFVDVFWGRPTEEEGRLQTRIQNQYSAWFDQCSKKRIKTGPLVHLLTEPVTLRDTDKYYGYRNGTTRKFVVQGLKLYVEMFKPNKALDF